MTIFDRMLQSRNAAIYRMMQQQKFPYARAAAGGGKKAVVPNVEAGTQEDVINAISAAEAEVVITLSRPIQLQNGAVVVPEGKTVTIDIDGNVLDSEGLGASANTKDSLLAVRRGGTLILEDSAGDGLVDGSKVGTIYAAVKLTEKGEDAEGEAAKVVINGGSYKGTYYAVTGNGSRQNTDVTVNGGRFEGTAANDSMAVYHPQNGVFVVNGGEFAGSTCFVQKSGKVTVNGGTFTANGIAQDFVHNRSGWNNTGDCFVVEACDYPGMLPEVEILGGTFISENGKPVASYAQNDAFQRITKFVKGGKFNKKLDDDLVADGFVQVEDGDFWKVVKAG